MKRIITNLLALALSLVTIAAWAEKPPHDGDGMKPESGDRPHHGRGHKKHFEKLVKELGLTKDQQEKAKAFHETRESLTKAQREKMKPQHEELRTLLEADKVDLAAVRKQLEVIGKGHVEIRMQDIQGRLEFKALLTPEQKKKLEGLHKKGKRHGKKPRREKKDHDK